MSVAEFPSVVDDAVVGGVGLSDGNGEQDRTCGLAALRDALFAEGHEVTTEADRTL